MPSRRLTRSQIVSGGGLQFQFSAGDYRPSGVDYGDVYGTLRLLGAERGREKSKQ